MHAVTQLGSFPWAHFRCTQLLVLENSVLLAGEAEKKIEVFMRKITVANTSINLYRHTNFEVIGCRYFLISSMNQSIIPCVPPFITHIKARISHDKYLRREVAPS